MKIVVVVRVGYRFIVYRVHSISMMMMYRTHTCVTLHCCVAVYDVCIIYFEHCI